MSIVVFQHIRAFGLNLNAKDSILPFVYLNFFLTTFFLLSGFFSGNLLSTSSFYALITKIYSKLKTLIIPTILFWIAYNVVAVQNDSMGIWGFPGGYWFTYTLFFISSLIGVMAYAFKKVKINNLVSLFLVIGLILQLFRMIFSSNLDTGTLYYLRARQFCTYFLYFGIGLLMSVNKDKTYSIMREQCMRTILFGGTLLLFLIRYSVPQCFEGIILSGIDFVLSLFSTLTVFTIFFLTKDYWDSESIPVRFINLVGKRSMDIYMLHYFFIPALPALTAYFASANNSIIELVVVGAVTILVLMISLLTSFILRMAKPLGILLFGK